MIPQELQSDYLTLVERVHWPVFREKLASEYGIVARNEEDKAALLELAGMLQVAQAEEAVKSASYASPYTSVVDELKGVMNKQAGNSFDTSLDRLVIKAAADLCGDGEIANAAANWAQVIS